MWGWASQISTLTFRLSLKETYWCTCSSCLAQCCKVKRFARCYRTRSTDLRSASSRANNFLLFCVTKQRRYSVFPKFTIPLQKMQHSSVLVTHPLPFQPSLNKYLLSLTMGNSAYQVACLLIKLWAWYIIPKLHGFHEFNMNHIFKNSIMRIVANEKYNKRKNKGIKRIKLKTCANMDKVMAKESFFELC